MNECRMSHTLAPTIARSQPKGLKAVRNASLPRSTLDSRQGRKATIQLVLEFGFRKHQGWRRTGIRMTGVTAAAAVARPDWLAGFEPISRECTIKHAFCHGNKNAREMHIELRHSQCGVNATTSSLQPTKSRVTIASPVSRTRLGQRPSDGPVCALLGLDVLGLLLPWRLWLQANVNGLLGCSLSPLCSRAVVSCADRRKHERCFLSSVCSSKCFRTGHHNSLVITLFGGCSRAGRNLVVLHHTDRGQTLVIDRTVNHRGRT